VYVGATAQPRGFVRVRLPCTVTVIDLVNISLHGSTASTWGVLRSGPAARAEQFGWCAGLC
jgi:hypothetical protein